MENSNKVHFMGIGGAGLSAVAVFAKEKGYQVSGCDIDLSSPFLPELKRLGIEVHEGHSENHLEEVNILVISPAIESLDKDNSEVKKAHVKQLPVFIGEKFLAEKILIDKKVIAISGTHGKSTTTALVSSILIKAGLDPSCLVGALVTDWGTNYRLGKGDYFVLEADEYQEKFLYYSPEIEVVTAIEMDHPEYFKDKKAVEASFHQFVERIKPGGVLILGKNLDLEVKNSVTKKEFELKNFNLKLIGKFNQENASLASCVGEALKIDQETIHSALEEFNGVERRFQLHGEENGIKIFDDYGHHPTAIEASVQAAKEKFPDKRIWLVYQPHMFTRTKYLFKEFAEVFSKIDVNEVIIMDIYAARQENNEKIESKDIVNWVNKPNVKYTGDFEKTADYLAEKTKANDIVIVMGAGDIYKLSELLLNKLKNKD